MARKGVSLASLFAYNLLVVLIVFGLFSEALARHRPSAPPPPFLAQAPKQSANEHVAMAPKIYLWR